MQSKRDIDIMRVEKRRKNEGERVEMLESTEIVREREREIQFKPQTKENLDLFTILKLYIRFQNLKDGLCLLRHNSS